MFMKYRTGLRWKSCLLTLGLFGLMCSLLQPLPGSFNLKINSAVSAQSITSPVIEGTIFAVNTANNLISFNQGAPNAIIQTVAITGLQAGEQIVGIDFRPRGGALIGVGSSSRVYTINPITGVATSLSATPFTPLLSGTSFGVDFNPTVDRIRVVSNSTQNLRLNPNNGAIAGADGNLAYAAGDPGAGTTPNLVASAYTSNFDGATTTNLFGIDSNRDTLVLQGSPGAVPVSPNTGQLTTVGSLGVNTTDQVGFDIASPSGIAFASLTPVGAASSALYTINLQTGAATLVGAIGGGAPVVGIAAVVRVQAIFALTTGNTLLSFNSGTPGTIASTIPITGLVSGENLLSIDFRPATGVLYAVSDQLRVFTINTTTGGATPVSGQGLVPPLNGSSFGFDFNPSSDRIRIVSDSKQNLRVNPINGTVAAIDGSLAFALNDINLGGQPNVVGAAYSNNIAGAAATSLYVIDSNLNALLLQGSLGGNPTSPNTGQLTTVGQLGLDVTDQMGFDIAPFTDAAFASLTPAGASNSSLYTINLSTGAATIIGAIGGNQAIRDIAIQPRIEIIYAVTNGNSLISFNAQQPGVIQSTAAISGLVSGEVILGLDFRPANGLLYAMGSTSRIYIINPVTGGVSLVGSGPTNPLVNGTSFGFDFNPVPDRIRFVSNVGQDLRFVPDNAATAGIDGNLAYAAADPRAGQPPTITGAAYTNSFAGSTSTTLYVIDSNFDALVTQGSPGGAPVSPNTGQLFTVGSLGVDTSDMVGFDIADLTNNAYASLTVGGVPQLYSVNLVSGGVTLIGNIAGNDQIRGIAIANQPSGLLQSPVVAAVNAASFAGQVIAPDSLVALFGRFQTTDGGFFSATSQPLPTSLGGLSVTVNGMDARLLAANNGQINLLAPQLPSDGSAIIVVNSADGTVDTTTVNIARAGPGVFTAQSTGLGPAAALTTSDGMNFQPVVNPDGSEREVSPGTPDRPSFLVLFVTGSRNATGTDPNDPNGIAEAFNVTIQNTNATVMWAGPAPGFSGLEQANVIIPPQLAGAGSVGITVSVNGRMANTTTISIGR
jgi:trimeric autotransporter adhesin